MTTTIAEEPFRSAIEEAIPLLKEHWEELARNKEDIPLDPDFTVYDTLERAGMLATFVVRKEGKMIGYAVYLVRRHPHYRQHVWAVSDLFWINPSHRDGRVGLALFSAVEKGLKARGVHVMHTSHKVDHPTPGVLLKRRGHAMIEHGYSKRLN
jgi:hypothetical protein